MDTPLAVGEKLLYTGVEIKASYGSLHAGALVTLLYITKHGCYIIATYDDYLYQVKASQLQRIPAAAITLSSIEQPKALRQLIRE